VDDRSIFCRLPYGDRKHPNFGTQSLGLACQIQGLNTQLCPTAVQHLSGGFAEGFDAATCRASRSARGYVRSKGRKVVMDQNGIHHLNLTPADFLCRGSLVALTIGGIVSLMFLLNLIPVFWGIPEAMISWAKEDELRSDLTRAFYFLCSSAIAFASSIPFALKGNKVRNAKQAN
jgi:hypothetical protein